MNSKIQNLLKYGIGLEMAKYFDNKGLSVTVIKSNSKRILINKFGLNKNEADEAKLKICRKPIPKDVITDLLIKNNFTCCCCLGQKGMSYIIHHIEAYEISQDNRFQNLAVICPICHDLAHSTRALTLTITKDQLYEAKETWEKSCSEKRKHSENYPLHQTWEAEFGEQEDDVYFGYSMDLSIWEEHGITKGYFNLIYLNRGKICLSGEFQHPTTKIDADVKVHFWSMNWNMRVSKKATETVILNYGFGDRIYWICESEIGGLIPTQLELKLIE